MTRLAAVFVALALLMPVATAYAGELPERTVASKVVDKKNQLTLKGNVSPTPTDREIVVQRKKCADDTCDWRRWATVTVNDTGGFRSRIDSPRRGSWWWRAKVPQGDGFATSYSQVWRTYNR